MCTPLTCLGNSKRQLFPDFEHNLQVAKLYSCFGLANTESPCIHSVAIFFHVICYSTIYNASHSCEVLYLVEEAIDFLTFSLPLPADCVHQQPYHRLGQHDSLGHRQPVHDSRGLWKFINIKTCTEIFFPKIQLKIQQEKQITIAEKESISFSKCFSGFHDEKYIRSIVPFSKGGDDMGQETLATLILLCLIGFFFLMVSYFSSKMSNYFYHQKFISLINMPK